MLEPSHAIGPLVKGRRVVVLCVGSNSGDDAAGPLLYKLVRRKLNNVKVLLGGTAPEQSISQIAAYRPDTVIMVNAVDKKLRPGDIVIEDLSEHHANLVLMHKFPLSLLAQLIAVVLEQSVELKLVGLQAKKAHGKISRQVAGAVANLARTLVEYDRWARQAG